MARSTAVKGPTTAERVRSTCARASDSMLAIPGSDPIPVTLHHLRTCGDVIVAVDTDSIANATAWQSGISGIPAVLELTDRAPLALREPVRSLVWLRGMAHAVPGGIERNLAAEVATEHPHPALLDVGYTTSLMRLVLASAVVADSTGAESVEVDELRFARADPFWEVEAAWLQHLDADHADVIEMLTRKLPPSMRTGAARPLAIDRYGITLRIEHDEDNHDVRLEFNEPADDVNALSKAIRILVGCPFLNGLRRRP